MDFYKAKDGNTYDLEELIDMLEGKDSKYRDFFKNLSGSFFDLLPLDVQIGLTLKSLLRCENRITFYLLNQGKL